MMFLLDTNILIAYFKNETSVVETLRKWKAESVLLFISPIIFAEVLGFAQLKSEDVGTMADYMNTLVEVPIGNKIAGVAGSFVRNYKIKLPDAIIAATVHSNHLTLVTRDKQFRKIKEINVKQI